MTFDIGLHEACVWVGGRAGVRYVITKFSQMDSLPNFLTHGAPFCARFARARSSAINIKVKMMTQSEFKMRYNPEMGRFTRHHIYGEV